MIPNLEYMEADGIQDALLNVILQLKENTSIENLYIDLKLIEEFIP